RHVPAAILAGARGACLGRRLVRHGDGRRLGSRRDAAHRRRRGGARSRELCRLWDAGSDARCRRRRRIPEPCGDRSVAGPKVRSEPMKRVLIIEDSRTQAVHLQMLLQRHGYGVEVTLDAASGLAVCRERAPDIVLCDVVMPGMDGYAFTRELKQDPALAQIPIVLVTALEDPKDVIRAIEAGADNYVTKPYHESRLVARLDRLLHPERRDAMPSERLEHTTLAPSAIFDVLVSCLEEA